VDADIDWDANPVMRTLGGIAGSVKHTEYGHGLRVVAWLKPKIIESKNTGHVAFVALPPARVTGYSDA
jgi:hypothetical protein